METAGEMRSDSIIYFQKQTEGFVGMYTGRMHWV